MTAPEPWREPPKHCEEKVRPDLYAKQGGSELGWGDGLVAPMYNGLPPGYGGIYMPKAPRLDPTCSGVGIPREHKRPEHEAKGYPGERVG
jgi:hypothetical protein